VVFVLSGRLLLFLIIGSPTFRFAYSLLCLSVLVISTCFVVWNMVLPRLFRVLLVGPRSCVGSSGHVGGWRSQSRESRPYCLPRHLRAQGVELPCPPPPPRGSVVVCESWSVHHVWTPENSSAGSVGSSVCIAQTFHIFCFTQNRSPRVRVLELGGHYILFPVGAVHYQATSSCHYYTLVTIHFRGLLSKSCFT
jgi:hypothetical protein